jgi:hypothetical protein
MEMNYYIVCLFQLFLWNGFSLALWLSNKDHLLYKTLLFLIFVYFALLIGKRYLSNWKQAWLMVVISLIAYYSIHEGLKFFSKAFN